MATAILKKMDRGEKNGGCEPIHQRVAAPEEIMEGVQEVVDAVGNSVSWTSKRCS